MTDWMVRQTRAYLLGESHMDIDELQDILGQWRQAFGEVKGFALENRIVDELEELFAELDETIGCLEWKEGHNTVNVLNEMADVVITMMIWCYENKVSLLGAVVKKHKVNCQRQWKLNGDGTAQHIKS